MFDCEGIDENFVSYRIPLPGRKFLPSVLPLPLRGSTLTPVKTTQKPAGAFEFGVVIIVQVTFIFASHKSDGDLRIQAFLNKAFLWYCKAMESTEDHFRYYYTPLTEANGGAQVSLMSEGEMTRARALGMGRRGGMGNASGSHAVQRRVP